MATSSAPVTLPKLGPLGWARWAWRQLTSMRTALFLLLLLVGLPDDSCCGFGFAFFIGRLFGCCCGGFFALTFFFLLALKLFRSRITVILAVFDHAFLFGFGQIVPLIL